MEFVEKHKALIITSMLMGIFVLSLYNINMVRTQKMNSEIMMEIPEEVLEELTEQLEELQQEEQEPIEQENRDLIAAKRTHQAFNEDFEDHSEFEQRIKDLTEDPTPSDETLENADFLEGDFLTENITTAEEINENKEQTEEKPVEKTNNRNSSVAWSLQGREKVDIPNPIYTCNASGKVVVLIQVSKNGYVTDTKIDRKNSTTRNECLFQNAMQYARKAMFSNAQIENQKGSITYYFNYEG